jgi:hypothetical protein
MYFESATRSIVRSVRQGDLLNAWLRVFKRERTMPLIHQFEPDRLEDERADLMCYEVNGSAGAVRFLIIHGGQNLIQAFGTEKGEGRFLDDLVDAERLKYITPAFLACIDARRPVYTVSAVSDVSGVPVSYERLALPFGANNNVQQLIVSLKTISIEGRFKTKDLMRRVGPAYQVCAVIDRDLDARNGKTAESKTAVADEVVEI